MFNNSKELLKETKNDILQAFGEENTGWLAEISLNLIEKSIEARESIYNKEFQLTSNILECKEITLDVENLVNDAADDDGKKLYSNEKKRSSELKLRLNTNEAYQYLQQRQKDFQLELLEFREFLNTALNIRNIICSLPVIPEKDERKELTTNELYKNREK